MKAQDNVRKDKKKRWEAPRIDIISGLDSCVEFLYIPGEGGGGGTGGPPPGGGGSPLG